MNSPAHSEPHPVHRAIELAKRLVREQEARVELSKTHGVGEAQAQALLDALRASLELGYRCEYVRSVSRSGADSAHQHEHERGYALTATPEPRNDPAQGVREEERKRIAQELHDDLGQQLNALGLIAHRVQRLAGARENGRPLGAAIRDLQAQVEYSLASVKRLTQQLRPLPLEALGFPAALEQLAAEFATRSNVRLACRFRVEGLAVSEPAATALFRIVQEALTNVARHACANTVTIDLYQDNAECVLRIADDGVGASSTDTRRHRSMGLSGMAERVAQLEGTLAIRTAEGAGFSIVARIPTARLAAPR